MQQFPDPLKNIAYLLLSFFSFAVYVHVSSLKYYERRAVRAMQAMENPVVSGGGSLWYMSFTTYIKIMLIIGSYSFLWTAVKNQDSIVLWTGVIVLTIFFGTVWLSDWKRTKPVLFDIRKNMTVSNSSTNT